MNIAATKAGQAAQQTNIKIKALGVADTWHVNSCDSASFSPRGPFLMFWAYLWSIDLG